MSDLFTHAKTDLKADIHHLLVIKPELRDNDNALVAEIWKLESTPGTSVTTFLNQLSDPTNASKLSSYKSIVRYRAMIQERNEALRGKRYFGRKEEDLAIKERSLTGGL